MLPRKMVQFGKNRLKISVFVATTTKKTTIGLLGEGVLVRGHAPRKILKKWCIPKCILIRFQDKNSVKISVLIGKNTKKGTSLLGKGGIVRGHVPPEKNRKSYAIWCILKIILNKF